MSILRTPDERFKNLPDFPFKPHYLQIGGLRVHYIDEGSMKHYMTRCPRFGANRAILGRALPQ
jgi:hypothetical protein